MKRDVKIIEIYILWAAQGDLITPLACSGCKDVHVQGNICFAGGMVLDGNVGGYI